MAFNNQEYANKVKQETAELTQQLEQGVKDVFSSDKFKIYLDFMSKFHNYSYNNCILIQKQNRNATLIAGYNAWQEKFKRAVNKGEKGIRILAPAPYKIEVEHQKTDDKGNLVTEKKQVQRISFRPVSVFDVSQTSGEPIPMIANRLQFNIEIFNDILQIIKDVSPYPIEFSDDLGGANGICKHSEKKLYILSGMSESQTIKTAINESTHAMIHQPEQRQADRQAEEVQAEATAYVICKHFDIDTSDYSFEYIASWSSNAELDILKNSLSIIQETANNIITSIEDKYSDILDLEKSTFITNESAKNSKKESTNRINKPLYSKEENRQAIEDIKQNVSIEEMAAHMGLTTKRIGTYITLKEHDSVRIDLRNNTYRQYSTGEYGSVIDFVINFGNYDTKTAIQLLSEYRGSASFKPFIAVTESEKSPVCDFELPQKAESFKNIFAYLIKTRKIDINIVSNWIKNGNLYQDKKNNCVFVGYDTEGKASFACKRGTNTNKRFVADVTGNDYKHCLYINNNTDTLVVTESPIDLMSVQTILYAKGRDFQKYNYCALSGTEKYEAVKNIVLENPNITNVVLGLDNDNAGITAIDNIKSILPANIKVTPFLPQNEKDWNAELQSITYTKEEKTSLTDKVSNAIKKASVHNQNRPITKESEKAR